MQNLGLMIEKKKYGDSFEEIRSRIEGLPIKVLKKESSIPYSNLGKYIKRLDAMLLTEMGNYISEMKIERVV